MTYSQEDVLHELREIRDDYTAALNAKPIPDGYFYTKTQRRLDVVNGLIKEKAAQLAGPRIDEVTP